ncbi:alcohol dehydrogenase catalytic domain-containing protein [Streptomyces sp. AM2-3-1]|uniref:alcohol dehydrogenase catalytic domain-containing protein n=1 Tax=unclassified Streptomyces TaxID=2593676 RepID=UPI0028C401A8|nr:alcohol dehydrogenase catalytic domain-containing protein [Streptomyces sp. AM2-3-1]WNO68204.1 alcohol dehydrogenase catalytic domain-containing protein [Streptomyces sp. AM2-3-1]WTE63307.1 alcohol dehydrogenase catalytic domain-containing protein [Streptomyces sp. NBC_01617]
MSTYRAFEVTGARKFELVEREVREPPLGHVRLRVEACGVCHTDVVSVEGMRPDPSSPVVPGHEVVGVIDAVGPGVTTWRVGERVGVGFLGGQCGVCDFCRRGDFVNCADQPQTGSDVDGGYAESMVARASGLVRIPEGIDSIDAAPLLCAGLTVFSALRQIECVPGALVAVQGIGGLGHLGVQYANKLGFRVAAIARGMGKAELAKRLGAEHYIDSSAEDAGAQLQKLGGAAAVVATAASGASMSPLVSGLAPRGRMVVVGAAADPVQVQTTDLIFGTRTVTGSLTGSSIDNEDSLRFAKARDVRPMTEVMPLAQAPQAYERMISGEARFRIVLNMAV